MLGSLHGTVTAYLEQRILIEVQGVGYWVHTGTWRPKGEITCYLHHHVREDMSDLYGFESLPNLQLFEKLLSISGIGPKAALALLSIGTSERIQQAIQTKDIAFLSSAPGIGPKAAQKIVLELHKKLDDLGGLLDDEDATSDLATTLMGLGYKANEISAALKKLPPEITTLDDQLKWVLKQV